MCDIKQNGGNYLSIKLSFFKSVICSIYDKPDPEERIDVLVSDPEEMIHSPSSTLDRVLVYFHPFVKGSSVQWNKRSTFFPESLTANASSMMLLLLQGERFIFFTRLTRFAQH